MSQRSDPGEVVRATYGLRVVSPDAPFEIGLAEHLKVSYTSEALIELYARFGSGTGEVDRMMRRAIWRVLTRRFGQGVTVGSGVGFKHPETFEIGDGVFVGDQAYIQGRAGGTCVIGNHVWIGPQSYLDARHLTLEDYVGWGPGAKALGSVHTEVPIDVPIIQTDLEIRPVRIEAWADIGVNAVILPGITVGRGSIVGAGAVVSENVPPMAVVAGVPARVIRWRDKEHLRG